MEPQQVIQERVIELETRLAFQEDLIGELNETVGSMQNRLDDLTRYCQKLQSKITEMATLLPADQNPIERPPHY